MIPKHEASGYLPEGIHKASWSEFVDRFGWNGRRATMLARVKFALGHLAACGSPSVTVGGSFLTTKAAPKDIDVVWTVTEDLNLDALHPMFHGPAGLPVIKALCSADVFPSVLIEAETGETFIEFFQHTRDGRRVGVVEIDLTTVDEDDG